MTNKDKIHALSRAVIIDKEQILLCKTLDLALNFYFLPGGHIEHGEPAENAVLREVLEESGASASIKRFLGCLEHSFEPGHSSICHNHEYNFVFEVECDDLKAGCELEQTEKHIKLVWIPIVKLGEIDFRPKVFRKLIPKWLESDMTHSFESIMDKNLNVREVTE